MEKCIGGKILKELIMAINKNLPEDIKEDKIKVNSLYGVFLLEYNRFLICYEHKMCTNEYPHLFEFFTDEYFMHAHEKNNKEICSWRKGGKVHLDCIENLEMVFCVPIIDLLDKFAVNKVTTEKDVLNVYKNVNKYIKENPNFIQQLFDSETEKVR